jgi:hypothetical protein
MLQIKVVDRIKTHVLYSKDFFENCDVYEIMRKNMVKPHTSQMTVKYGACALEVG